MSSASCSVSAVGFISMPRVSSFLIVKVTLCGASTTSFPPSAVAETVTVLSAACTSLSAAVMVTTPVLVFESAGIVSVLLSLKVKSPVTVGATGSAETLRVTGLLDFPSIVAVIVLALVAPLSFIDGGVRTSVTVGVSSLSSIVIEVSVTVTPERLPVTLISSSGSSKSSLFRVSVKSL